MSDLVRRVVARYRDRLRGIPQYVCYLDAATFKIADQAPGQRAKDTKNTKSVNPLRGIDKGLVKDNARTEDDHIEETVTPNRRDIQPKDVFSPGPSSINVLNFAETGKDQDKALRNQVPNDKGWDTVKNLSQYLIRTEGGGGTPAVGKK